MRRDDKERAARFGQSLSDIRVTYPGNIKPLVKFVKLLKGKRGRA